ncbi:putative Serpin (serine protease inhibitor) [Blattamonas nauphoetae]|uniref:Serpin (Serine protease inhibitor) n=1 Tax=Blattamonas nauphoetae TaxID=2049346 RepID=A0ABQ9XIJ1_9EUKA|nr:putative Serpin (serine protease inhibitor) [Blattamonas nauphoetae]
MILLLLLLRTPAQQASTPSADIITFHSNEIASINKLASKLLSELSTSQRNAFISPRSVYSTLLALMKTADSQTKESIASALSITSLMTNEDVLGFWRRSQAGCQLIGSHNEFDHPFSLWLKTGRQPQESFTQDLKIVFNSSISEVPFGNTLASQKFSSYVQEFSNNQVQSNALDHVTGDANLIGILPVPFQRWWTNKFAIDPSGWGVFTAENGTAFETRFLKSSGSFEVNDKDKNVEVVISSLSPGRIQAMFIRPKRIQGSLNQMIEEILAPETFNRLFSTQTKTIDFAIPQFNISDTIDLRQALYHSGFEHIFDDSAFVLMASSPVGLHTLYQPASLSFTEHGINSFSPSPSSPSSPASSSFSFSFGSTFTKSPLVKFDSPFLFLLVDRQTTEIHFAAVVNDVPGRQLSPEELRSKAQFSWGSFGDEVERDL